MGNEVAGAPRCFDTAKDWELYQRGVDLTTDKDHTYCADCTPARQAKMKAAGRCEHPGVVFVVIEQVLTGRRPT